MAVDPTLEVKLFGKWTFDDVEVRTRLCFKQHIADMDHAVWIGETITDTNTLISSTSSGRRLIQLPIISLAQMELFAFMNALRVSMNSAEPAEMFGPASPSFASPLGLLSRSDLV